MSEARNEHGADQRIEAGHCRRHGAFEARFFRLGSRWLGGECPECAAESVVAQQRRDAESRRAAEQERLMRLAGIPRRFAEATLANYEPPTERAEKVHEACRRYVETFEERLAQGSSLILSGNVGTGKSHLACAIVKAVIQRHRRLAAYMTVMQAVRRVRSTYSPDAEETEEQALERICEPDLLVLDEVGVQLGSQHEHATLFEIINRRYQDVRPTILVSNLGLRELCEAIGERLVDRLRENGAVLTFAWDSYRRPGDKAAAGRA